MKQKNINREIENQKISAKIIDILSNTSEPMTTADIVNALDEQYSYQRISAVLWEGRGEKIL